MNHLDWGDLTPETFLKEYWQKKPLLIKGGFKNFIDPLTPEELAGFSMEEEIESRIIAKGEDHMWSVEHGPFESFDDYGDKDWTLLVQATNNWSSETHDLLKPFRFMPNWRLDDVMVSFSTPNGGVGPHLDRYDVFIIQGQGKRHWRVGLPDDSLETLVPHEDLKQVSDFEAIIDVITESGDILYIPPNHPHDGIAVDNALNYSIGFQAPSSQELISTFADLMIDRDIGNSRYGDPKRKPTDKPEELTHSDIVSLQNFMVEAIKDRKLFNNFIGGYLTHNHHTLEIIEPEEQLSHQAFESLVASGDIIIKPVLGIKALYNCDNASLFVNGNKFVLGGDCVDLAKKIAQGHPLTAFDLESSLDSLNNVNLLTTLINMGYWYIDQNDEL
ncbi:cupin domain-containing protein [Thalassotalea eurytherma]|uniref:50S ribosomal protein L16 arginine hydroxylase n=1 Tax=Thalassotalea eurytherma TaxID=1144278 RepID=A0ABQ6H0T3_9GAMM|nr:cupin domain-containing protein [Thalassotalea eurytherma]GLX81813.1 50S ribosomal protein L16 arginine hydroxylase [Thalassotalea eurytherma]